VQQLIVLAFVGFLAQLIDGALGMGYGVTSTSLVILSGIAPAIASASVHTAEVVTTIASAISHIKLKNVDRRLVLRMALPGAIGAFVGAVFLSSIPGDVAKPWIAGFLFLLGIVILLRFAFPQSRLALRTNRPSSNRFLGGLGLIAGFFDATGGGGWGPIATTTLLAKEKVEPRKVVGSVDTSETVVALAATIGFVISMGWDALNMAWLSALMVGGVIAAPLAAGLVSRLPSQLLGFLVSGLILLTNARTLFRSFGATTNVIVGAYVVLILGWLMLIAYVLPRQQRRQTQQPLHG
jgi:uncharacterized membrane protein YfcA